MAIWFSADENSRETERTGAGKRWRQGDLLGLTETEGEIEGDVDGERIDGEQGRSLWPATGGRRLAMAGSGLATRARCDGSPATEQADAHCPGREISDGSAAHPCRTFRPLLARLAEEEHRDMVRFSVR